MLYRSVLLATAALVAKRGGLKEDKMIKAADKAFESYIKLAEYLMAVGNNFDALTNCDRAEAIAEDYKLGKEKEERAKSLNLLCSTSSHS